ncbi:MAG: class I SAM-dependent methyltransferase family protein [archaeon]|nr:MAG: class I SAM-dependent methyltransferase family protein [archaeon]
MKYQKIGDIIILNRKDMETAERLLSYQPNTKTVMYRASSIFGRFREPKLKKLAGNGTVTVHREHGCSFKIDVEKIMWSKGNHRERVRLINKVEKGEVIVDMFAGIGYFSIPLAKKSKAGRIYAVELNPVAFSYLLDNIRLNRTRKITAINADSGKVDIPEKADRVLMGLLPSPRDFMPKALELARKGGMIHYHGLDGEEPDNLWQEVREACRKKKAKCELAGKSRVKSWNPKKWHWVLDVRIKL